jgi:hypothetical protein
MTFLPARCQLRPIDLRHHDVGDKKGDFRMGPQISIAALPPSASNTLVTKLLGGQCCERSGDRIDDDDEKDFLRVAKRKQSPL